jgi:predicted membrane-bound spermidine synthase
MDSFRKSFYAGIFLVAGSTLLLEITLTKVFSVIHYHYFAFLIVSTALFGYGFSGVSLSIFDRLKRIGREKMLFGSSLLFALTVLLSFRLILAVPLSFTNVFSENVQYVYLAAVYLLLALPFFFSGLVIGVLLSSYPDNINRLYFADLTGAGLGCFAIVFLIPVLGGSGTVLAAAILAGLSALFFARRWAPRALALALVACMGWLVPHSERVFPISQKSEKRYFQESLQKGKLLFTGWSPASRIDVVRMGRDLSVIWIDGGTNQSFMRRLDPKTEFRDPPPKMVRRTVEMPYAFTKHPRVLIIGPGGGVEIPSALEFHPVMVRAVELDPLIVKVVLGQFADYNGHIFTRPNVTLINEEGRSYIRRSSEKFDIIQQKNSSHPMAVASGALNLTETYLLTKEAFHEYLDHLNPNGFITIQRHGGIRLLNLAVEVLQERGVQEPWKRIVVIGQSPLNQVFLMKNGDFTDSEIDYIENYCRAVKDRTLYTPRMRQEGDGNIFARLMAGEESRRRIIREAPFHLQAPTDDKPFMEHFFRLASLFSPAMQRKQEDPFWRAAALREFTSGQAIYSDLSLYVILLEAILLSTVFIIYPLIRMKRSGIAMKGAWRLLAYFSCLGIGFIFIEIAFIQKYILFIGYPVYAVAAIIFALLIAAGAGSFYSSRFVATPFRMLRVVVPAIVVLTLLQVLLVPFLFRAFLSVSFASRMALSILFILPIGFVMGMPFPLGLSWTSKNHPAFVPWAWGINGYATVIGSVLSVVLALNFGFHAVLLIAAAIYIVAYFALRRASPEAV